MSESENVRRVRQTIEAFNRGEHERIVAGVDPGFELKRASEAPDSDEVVRGPGAFARWLRPDAFESMRLEIDGITEVGEKVLVEGHARGVGRGSGVEIDQHVYVLYTVSGDRITAMEVFFDLADAEKAAGLG
jgi:ketosteroid isomerase-like protein